MTPEEKPTDEQAPKEEEAKAKPAAAKKPAAKSSAAAKPAAAKKAAEKTPAAKADKPVEEKKATRAPKPAAARAGSGEDSAAKKASEAKAPAEKPAGKAPVEEKPAEQAKPAPEAKSKRVASPRPMVVRAQARYVRTSARKARMVCGHIRGKSVADARAILAFTPRGVARDWSKLLESAIANAENNHELLQDDLYVREAYADEGPTIKRFRPRARGSASPILKRTSHLTLTLTPKP
jgi:ribosomal protein L22